MDQQEVDDVCVENSVDLVVSDWTQFENLLRSVVSYTNHLTLVLKEARNVVDNREGSQVKDVPLCLTSGAKQVPTGAERATDSQVSVEGDKYRQENGPGIWNLMQWPEEGYYGKVDTVVAIQQPRVGKDVRQKVEWNGGCEYETVGHSQGVQKEASG